MKVRKTNAVLDLGSNPFRRSFAAALSGDENRPFRNRFDRRPVADDRATAACTEPTGTSPDSAPTGGRRHPLLDQKRLPLAAAPQELPTVEDGLSLLLELESGACFLWVERAASSVGSRVGRKALPAYGRRVGQPKRCAPQRTAVPSATIQANEPRAGSVFSWWIHWE